MSSKKKLCDYKKRVEENLAHLKEISGTPTHICKKCARVSNDPHLLCKPLEW